MKRVAMMLMLLVLCGCQATGDWSASVLTDVKTSMVEGRVSREIDANWSAGLLATWFPEDAVEPHQDWGAGGFVKYIVNPDATVPFAKWFPWVGTWLELPESISAQTYMIAKLQALPYSGGVDVEGSPGVGATVGPMFLEYTYAIIESGDADTPEVSSGSTLWVGVTPIRF